MEREHIVAAVVAAAGGTLTSRVRFQKTVYLLDQYYLPGHPVRGAAHPRLVGRGRQ